MKPILPKMFGKQYEWSAKTRREKKRQGKTTEKKKNERKHLVPAITRLLFGRDVVPAFSFSLMRL